MSLFQKASKDDWGYDVWHSPCCPRPCHSGSAALWFSASLKCSTPSEPNEGSVTVEFPACVKCVAYSLISDGAPVLTWKEESTLIEVGCWLAASILYLCGGILSAFNLEQTPASYQTVSKRVVSLLFTGGSLLRGFDTLWHLTQCAEILYRHRREGYFSVYAYSSVHVLLLLRLLLLNKCWGKKMNVGCLWTVFTNVGQRSIVCTFWESFHLQLQS